MTSFSVNVREELLKQLPRNLSQRQAILAGIFCSSELDANDEVKTSIKLPEGVAEFTSRLLKTDCVSFEKKDNLIQISSEDADAFRESLGLCFRGNNADILSSDEGFRRCFLRGVYINCGYLSDPEKTYRLELHLCNVRIFEVLLWMLHAEDMEPAVSKRGGKTVIRLREGDKVSDFLAIIGATNAMLSFENIRAEHEILDRVNKQVNCDSANARRQAEAGAKRTEMFIKLLDSPKSRNLSEEMLSVLRLHVDNPGLSITEFGKMMDPPISKSGMNHRLKKLMEIAEEC